MLKTLGDVLWLISGAAWAGLALWHVVRGRRVEREYRDSLALRDREYRDSMARIEARARGAH